MDLSYDPIPAARVVTRVFRWEGTPGPESCSAPWLPDAIEYECTIEPPEAAMNIWAAPVFPERRQQNRRGGQRRRPDRRQQVTYASVCAKNSRR